MKKAIHWIIAAAAFVRAEPVQSGILDPEVLIYRFPGVIDDGGTSVVGVATMFYCTNFSGNSDNIRLVTRAADGTLKVNFSLTVQHLETRAFATHDTALFEVAMNTGAVTHGTTAIAATSINIICTAMIIDAANPTPTGVALRGIRFNPVPGSQE